MCDLRNADSASLVRSDVNASHLPSGEKFGAEAFHSPLVIWRGVPPSAGITKMWRTASSVNPMRSER